jgi:hypothetical protein
MSKYFQYFPSTPHDLTNIGQKVTLTNILRRFTIENSIKENVDVFHDYSIQAGDRPDTIAAKYYKNADFAWVVLMFNEIHDPIFGWPLFNDDFNQYIKSKYGNLAAAQSTVHEYRWILNTDKLSWNDQLNQWENKRNNDNSITKQKYVVVDQTTYNSLTPSVRKSVSKYDWEVEENEKKRQIKILDRRYLSLVQNEVRTVLRNGV